MTRTATIGTTSYGFRYLLMDARSAPSLVSLIERTREAGLEALQICENARPLQATAGEWREAIRAAGDAGVGLHVGCLTLNLDTLAQYLELAAAIPGADTLRIVMENEHGIKPGREAIVRFLDGAMSRLERSRMKLAIENHFHIPCRTLAEAARGYPAERVAFCIDTANSLRNWEAAEQVFAALDSRVVFYHLKDFKVEGTNVGFSVRGAPLGDGDLDLPGCLERIYARPEAPLILLENWVPQSGDRDRDVAADAEWLSRSLVNLRRALAARFAVTV
jgi:sugar phosphate isomerase/epimerase